MKLYVRRIVAYLIDFGVLSFILGIYMLSGYLFYQKAETMNKAIFMVLCAVVSVYFLCGYIPVKSEGQTIGKMITRLQVVSIYGKKRSLWHNFCREFILKYSFVITFVPVVVIYYIINIIMRKSLQVQFIHDELLHTQVISKESRVMEEKADLV
jgi:uncharacterized RDD family membrane protein YckC